MEEKMESEQSFSGETSSSSDTSSGSSDGDDEAMETVRLLGRTLELPQELCEDYSVFKEFFSMRTWEALEDKQKEQLKNYLPTFPDNDKEEKDKTVKMLFNHEPLNFSSPMSSFYNNLRQGNYRPDIAKMKKFLMKARAKQQKHKVKSYYAKLLPEVLISRERLLAAVKSAPPGSIPRLPLLPPKPSVKNKYKPTHLRAKQRYFEELAAIQSEVGGEESEDENYPDGPPEHTTRKRKQSMDMNVLGTLGGYDASHPTSLDSLKNILAAHRSRRQYRDNHPELNTSGITIEDIKQRVALVNGTKKLMFRSQKGDTPAKIRRGPKKDGQKGKELKSIMKKPKDDQQDSVENRPLLPNIKIKCEQEESDSESSSLVDPVSSPKQTNKLLDQADIKQEVDMKYPNVPNVNFSENKVEIKQEPPDPSMPIQNSSKVVQHVPIKLEDLDGIDMMALPVEIADDSGGVISADTSGEASEEHLVDADESLTETTHANFLSLVRALFPARAAHRASKQQLHARCAAVMKSPIAPLNTWYSLSDDWCAELGSALDFLAGERGPHPDDFVPYLQFLPETQMYQWIGAGRDCDAILGRLCERWLRCASPGPPACEPPPPRFPTSWVMRAPTSTEITEFRVQERKRFSSAAKPFTYIQHGYRSVVGPCARASISCGTQGSLLVAERPRHATFIALVRDAVARLPNGEGTRHDILTLLKMSQWIGTCNDQALLGALSSALDRLHSAKRDPVVKYDQRTAVWTYLHRNRSEEDWVKTTGRGRKMPASAAHSPSPAATPPPKPVPRETHTAPLPAMELEIGNTEEVVENASDSDVDVDDTSATSSVPHLSSAQLLMQATQATQPKLPPPPPKPKGKLVATPPQKAKTGIQIKQPKPTLMTQSVKQANLLSQATKATLMNQAVKQANLLNQAKQANLLAAKQAMAAKANALKQATPQAKTNVIQKPAPVIKTNLPKPNAVQMKQVNVKPVQPPKTNIVQKPTPPPPVKPVPKSPVPSAASVVSQVTKTVPTVVAPPQKSPLIKQRPLQRVETPPTTIVPVPVTPIQTKTTASVIQTTVTVASPQNAPKLVQGTRSLLIRPPVVQTTVTATVSTPTAQAVAASRRGVVRVLSPATPSSGKSLISPRALMQTGTTTVATAKKRPLLPVSTSVSTVVQTTASATTVVSSAPTVVSSSAAATRTVQLGGRTVQLSANQTVHLPGGQAVQLTSGHTLQLSSLQLPTHSVRLPSGQTVQLASPQTMQAVRAVSSAAAKNTTRVLPSSPTVKTIQTTQSTVPIPVSTVQLSGQTVQIGGQTVQLAGQSVQLTGHTVKLPSGQSVQVASQSVLPSQSVQLPSGQTVQLASGNVQTVQLGSGVQMPSGQSVQIPSGQSVQLGSQTVQLSGQTVQLAGGQTVQLPSGQTLQLSSGQTVQLSSGQTLQLASGQTVQLTNPQTPKTVTQVVRSQASTEKPAQPIVAKLLTGAQGQMISLEGMVGSGRTLQQLQVSGVRPRAAVRVLSPARPLLLTAAKPLHNIILQQGDGNSIRVTSSSSVAPSQTIVLGNLGAQNVTTSTTSAPVLKLQQVNSIQQVKLAQGIKIQQASPATSTSAQAAGGVRGVVMEGQQLKLVGGRHVLARILRPTHPPP